MCYCTKTTYSGSGYWPNGNYCIARYGGSCPTGVLVFIYKHSYCIFYFCFLSGNLKLLPNMKFPIFQSYRYDLSLRNLKYALSFRSKFCSHNKYDYKWLNLKICVNLNYMYFEKNEWSSAIIWVHLYLRKIKINARKWSKKLHANVFINIFV